MESMQMTPQKINNSFGHLGGVGEVSDKVFGVMEFEDGWMRDMQLNFLNEIVDVILWVDSEYDSEEEAEDENDTLFSKGQYEAYQKFMEQWENIQHDLLPSILGYYQQKRHELGYDVKTNDNYPEIETTEQLKDYVTLDLISVPYGGAFDGREMGVVFDCTWDEENGIGIRLINEKVSLVGYQDIT